VSETISVGDRVQVFLDPQRIPRGGWFEGTVVRVDPYSRHRRFYWVRLDPPAQDTLGIQEISVFNPRNIHRLDG
jgi:hypothetical protein